MCFLGRVVIWRHSKVRQYLLDGFEAVLSNINIQVLVYIKLLISYPKNPLSLSLSLPK